jgi:hypothetical protein
VTLLYLGAGAGVLLQGGHMLGTGAGMDDWVEVSLENAAAAPRNMRQINDERSSDFMGKLSCFSFYGSIFGQFGGAFRGGR